MARYDRVGSIDVYKKKSEFKEVIIAIIILFLFISIIGSVAG